ncbi:MAG TPA: DUF2169 domain-containing protein [Myxococcaceae bacterium]|nr:DUF2169 domain-containing protein [Myxococcaceae bacterium]
MDTPVLNQATPATVRLIPQLGMDGGTVIVVIIKERFHLERRNQVARIGGAQVRLADEPWDEDKPETSSVKCPADVCLRKPSTDIVFAASAVGAHRVPATSLDVSLRVGPVETKLRVFGLRVWYKGIAGLALSPPQPFEELPLRWEYAYGGFDASVPEKPLEEPRNPVGRGVARDPSTLIHKAAPAIEDPADLISSHRSKPAPAGVGALGRHWEPRRSFAGTMDERWKKERMPLLPLDFDERYNQVAPRKLIAPSYLRGGEPVELQNLCEDGPLRFNLPRLVFFVGARTDDGLLEHRPALDTVLLEPNERRFELTWRAAIPSPKRSSRLRAVQVHEKAIL